MVVVEDATWILISALLFGLLRVIECQVSEPVFLNPRVLLSHFILPKEVRHGQDRTVKLLRPLRTEVYVISDIFDGC